MSLKEKTICAGSEEFFEFMCDSCSIDDKQIEAKGFCKDCGQNLCFSCIKVHKQLSSLRKHAIEDKPKTPSGQENNKDANPFSDRCMVHTHELIKYFCYTHNTLTCNECLSWSHRNCKDVSYIGDASFDISNSDEFQTLQRDLRRIEATLTYYKTTSEKVKTDVIESCSEAVDEINILREDFNKRFDELEKSLLDTIQALKKEHTNCLDGNSSSCQNLLTETTSYLNDLDDKKERGLNNQLFISVKQITDSIPKLVRHADSIGEKCIPRRLSFKRDEEIDDFLSKLQCLGTMLLFRDQSKIKAKYERDIPIKSKTDKQDCNISGAVFLPDGRLCLCDQKNKSIKLIDSDAMVISDQLVLPAEPKNVSVLGQSELAVTIKGDENLRTMTVSPTLQSNRTIILPYIYNGLAFCEDKLLLTAWDETNNRGDIDIFDMEGNRIKQINTDADGSKLFTDPFRICTSPDNALIYVTDIEDNTVTCIDMDGKVLNVYRNKELVEPRGITTDEKGNVYVCSNANNTIHKLTRTCQANQILLTQKNGIKSPFSIAYRSSRLYVSSSNIKTTALRNNIKVFELTTKW